jgi:hypothetical protein
MDKKDKAPKDRAPYGDRADYLPPHPSLDQFPERLAHKPTHPDERSRAEADARRGKLPHHIPGAGSPPRRSG